MKLLFATLIALGFGSSSHASIKRFHEVEPGLYRGGEPSEQVDYVQLKERLGVRTIINLRTSDESPRREEAIAQKLGIRVISIPLSAVTPPSDRDMKRILELVSDPNERPLFLHCREGKDRTGLVFGLYRVFAHHWTRAEAYREMLAIGFSEWLAGLRWYFWHATSGQPLL